VALNQNPLPHAVDSLLELRCGRRADLIQIWFGGSTHDQEVLFRHAAYDGIAALKWQHINPYGTFTLNMSERLPLA